jgi:hypothetical protein
VREREVERARYLNGNKSDNQTFSMFACGYFLCFFFLKRDTSTATRAIIECKVDMRGPTATDIPTYLSNRKKPIIYIYVYILYKIYPIFSCYYLTPRGPTATDIPLLYMGRFPSIIGLFSFYYRALFLLQQGNKFYREHNTSIDNMFYRELIL